MARTTYGDIITELTGSVGGVTFQRNKSGQITRQRPYTCVNPTPAQQARQLALTNLIAFWQTMNPYHKVLWDELAAAHKHTTPWGKEKTISGYQWFLSYNLVAYNQGTGPFYDPAPFTVVPPVQQFSVGGYPTQLVLDFDTEATFPSKYAGIFATPPLRQSSLKLRRPTYFIKLWETAPTTVLDITAFYEQYFGVNWQSLHTTGQCTIIIRMVNYLFNTGYQSTFVSDYVSLNF